MDPAHFDVLLTPTIAHDGLMRFGRFFRCCAARAGIYFRWKLLIPGDLDFANVARPFRSVPLSPRQRGACLSALRTHAQQPRRLTTESHSNLTGLLMRFFQSKGEGKPLEIEVI